MANAKNASEQLKATARKVSRETGVGVADVEKVLKAGYVSTMEFVIDQIKAEMSKTRSNVDVGAIEKLKSNPVMRDTPAPRDV